MLVKVFDEGCSGELLLKVTEAGAFLMPWSLKILIHEQVDPNTRQYVARC